MKRLLACFAVALALVPLATQADDIVETAVGADQFNTLVAAVQAAGLEDTLRGEGPFTIFAPTDEAFADLDEGFIENLLLPENQDQLVDILAYHIVPGQVVLTDMAGQAFEVETVEGDLLSLNAAEGAATVNGVSIVTPDVQADNGVIHVIDAVLLPIVGPDDSDDPGPSFVVPGDSDDGGPS